MDSRDKIRRRKVLARNHRWRNYLIMRRPLRYSYEEALERYEMPPNVFREIVQLPRPVAVEPREGYTIWVRCEDGLEGVIDVSHLADLGFFKAWRDRAFFECVYVNEKTKCVEWGLPWEITEIDHDVIYAGLLGITNEHIDTFTDDDEFDDAVEKARKDRGLL